MAVEGGRTDKFALIRRDVVFEGGTGSAEGGEETSVVEMFFWVGEDGSVRNINTDGIVNKDGGGFVGLFGLGEGFSDDFCVIVELFVLEHLDKEVAFGTASRGATVFNGVEAQDTDILRHIKDTLTEKLSVFVHSNRREERLEEGGHRRLFVACR
jgi:hypothetical protein